jgi:translation initiation factor 2 beta subunit (eIF-2beta)/eIF-5
MQKNATIEEVRKTRQEISRKYEYDPKKLIQFYIDRQKIRISTNSRTEPRVRGPVD